MNEEFTHMGFRSHKRIEIDAGTPAHRLMEYRVDVVRTAFEGLHTIAFPRIECHQATGNRRLA